MQHKLLQILENYQRCGVRQLARQPLSDELQRGVERLLELKRQSRSVTTSERSATGAPRADPIAAPRNDPGTVPRVETSAAAGTSRAKSERISSDRANRAGAESRSVDAPEEGVAGQPWSLPVLELEQRRDRFNQLAAEVRACRLCTNIVKHRQQTVFGTGSLEAEICFMGEAPGADEDRVGEPFVGRAGQLLTKIIAAMQLRREDVYILNALKCRPPQNRTPVPEEIHNCRHYVETQLDVLQPKYIVCLGAVAVRSILQNEQSIGRLRGRFHTYRGAKVVVTYHPSYLLRNASAKRLVWEDMQMLMRDMGTVPEE